MRDLQIDNALAGTPWGEWTKTAIAGDASARRYFRLTHSDEPSLILMDDPTLTTAPFAKISDALTRTGLSAPKIYLHEPRIGLMVIEDLGSIDFARQIERHPNDELALYHAANKVIIALHTLKPSLSLATITPAVAADMIDLASLHYAATEAGKGDLQAAMLRAYSELVDPEPHLALRDFHAENLIWRSQLSGIDRVGLLDFQDAVFAPAGYDLMSLLRDARRDVSSKVADEIMVAFCNEIGRDMSQMSAHLACVSVQRNLRILGIFARLAKRDGKVKYLSLLPRVWAHLMTDLAHPAMVDLRKVVMAELPPPNTETLQRLGTP